MLKDSERLSGASAHVAKSPAKAGRKMRANFRIAAPKVRKPRWHLATCRVNPHNYGEAQTSLGHFVNDYGLEEVS